MSSRLTPEQRRLRGQYGAAVSWKNTRDRTARTTNARRAFERRFEDEVDPKRLLPDEQRKAMAAQARKAFFLGLSLKASVARSRGEAARSEATNRGEAARSEATNLDAVAAAAETELKQSGGTAA